MLGEQCTTKLYLQPSINISKLSFVSVNSKLMGTGGKAFFYSEEFSASYVEKKISYKIPGLVEYLPGILKALDSLPSTRGE